MTRALSLELEENYIRFGQKEAVYDEILQNLPEKSTSNFCSNFSQASGTLQSEFNQLLDLKLVIRQFLKVINLI